ncbi:BREX-1 system phosphatase PglZ type A [Siminovitchia fortis]|uniref:BREX-1 system phosphatase PglZ type A n=1 Tax=Siminovitchia fortis TaxID=254758 RepID=A0A443J277_9BACI|nr:BREX-1 system phosphatase PglZ type A [Siminovitchia fortis]RWR14658.1 BREX-1 system phosphatase PglZ type A [Siminovitchia fortis]WHY80342.1 BREX-1 system phosphatase PglZ type A [Siminovitchia fortis]
MNLREIHRVLNDIYQKELTNGRKRHIVFWYDEEGEFIEDVDEIKLENVRIWKVTDHNLFATKYELEKKDTKSHFLLYANMPKPVPREDWLYDLYKIGHEFATDKITVIMRELGINDDGLRETFKSYKEFFNSRARFQSFQKYQVEFYTEETIDLTVLAVLCKSPTNTLDDILRRLFSKYKDNDESARDRIRKYGDEEKFWWLVEKYYGYTLPDRSIRELLIFFMLTYLSEQNPDMEIPETWQKYVSRRPANIIVFMDQWMNHRLGRHVFNLLSDEISDVVRANHYADQLDIEDIIHLDAFSVYDEKIIRYLAEQLTSGINHFEQYFDIIAKRRKLHWYPEYRYEYGAVLHAAKLLNYMEKWDYFIPEQPAAQMFQAYTEQYYVIDTAYRKFYAAYDQAEEKERLHQLRDKIENIYVHHFMEELALKWSGSLERDHDMVWPIDGILQQKEFYRDWVHGYQTNDERVFVIISDALRYEAAKELADILNNQRKAAAEITSIQSVIPSYTALGMASLLPYEQMEYSGGSKFLLDGTDSAGITNRNAILQGNLPDSIAIQYNEVNNMSRSALRETFQGKKVIYIYHNVIDARGDHAATEGEVFHAVDEAIDDIRLLVNQLVNNLSASNILITSDHGFIYQRDSLQMSQKLLRKPEGAELLSRRFSIMKNKEVVEGTWTFAMDYILDHPGGRFAIIPKGIHRFAIQGAGANYVHGGAMLQEIVVPVITFKNDRSKSSRNTVKKVDVKLTTPTRKITNMMTFLEFFQMEKVEEKKLPLRLKLYFTDEEGNRVSNENRIIADSESSQAVERTYREKFVFKSEAYDKGKTYYLILEDEEEKAGNVYDRYPFTIDIAYTSDGLF